MTYKPFNAELVSVNTAIEHVKNDGWKFRYVPVKLSDIYTYGLFVVDPAGNEYDVVLTSKLELKTFIKTQSLVNFHFEQHPDDEEVLIPKLPDLFKVKR